MSDHIQTRDVNRAGVESVLRAGQVLDFARVLLMKPPRPRASRIQLTFQKSCLLEIRDSKYTDFNVSLRLAAKEGLAKHPSENTSCLQARCGEPLPRDLPARHVFD
jgi:hypothetical protein